MKPNFEKPYTDPQGGVHTISGFFDPNGSEHVFRYDYVGKGQPWKPSEVAGELKKEGIEPFKCRLYETVNGGWSRYDTVQLHRSSVGSSGLPAKGLEKLASSQKEFDADVARVQEQRLDQNTMPRGLRTTR